MIAQPGWAGGDGPSAPGEAAQPRPGPRWRRSLIAVALLLGLCGLAAATAGVVNQILPRRFTAAQQRQIETWEVSRRWRAMPAGTIFPARIGYQVTGAQVGLARPVPLHASRLGIAAQAPCRAAADPATARILARYGCQAVLRATYVDGTGSLVVTVGIAPVRSRAAAAAAAAALTAASRSGGPAGGLAPVRYPGTLAARFGPAQRQLMLAGSQGPYVVMSVAGYTDGRPQVRLSADPYMTDEMNDFATGVANAVSHPLGQPPAVPRCPGAPGC